MPARAGVCVQAERDGHRAGKILMEKTSIKDALLEIGSEELPASFVPMGMKQLQVIAERSLAEHQLAFKAVSVFGTPRRIAVCIHELAGHSPDQQRNVIGPPAANATDASAQSPPPAARFARN